MIQPCSHYIDPDSEKSGRQSHTKWCLCLQSQTETNKIRQVVLFYIIIVHTSFIRRLFTDLQTSLAVYFLLQVCKTEKISREGQVPPGQNPGGGSHRKRTGGCSLYRLGVNEAVLVPLGVLNLKRSTAGVFAVPFRVLSRKKYDMRLWFVLKLVPLSLGVTNISSHAHKTGSWYLLWVFFKISHEHPRPFDMEVPRGQNPRREALLEKLAGVRPASKNPYPIYDQNLRFSLPYLWPNQTFMTVWADICTVALHIIYEGPLSMVLS